MKNIGANIRRVRRARGLTEGELAEKVGVSLSTLKKYESGGGGYTIRFLTRFASALDCGIEDILGLDAAPPDLIHAAVAVHDFCFGPDRCGRCKLYNWRARDCNLRLISPYRWDDIPVIEAALAAISNEEEDER